MNPQYKYLVMNYLGTDVYDGFVSADGVGSIMSLDDDDDEYEELPNPPA